MLEFIATIVLLPFAIGALIFTGAIIAGLWKYVKRKK